jgi:hypothetical protein
MSRPDRKGQDQSASVQFASCIGARMHRRRFTRPGWATGPSPGRYAAGAGTG